MNLFVIGFLVGAIAWSVYDYFMIDNTISIYRVKNKIIKKSDLRNILTSRKAVSEMREILFRGKRKDTGEWVEGHLHKMDGYGTGYTEYGIQVQVISTSRPWSVLLLPETVGQYTGLTDKNGKRIFEGDIVAGALHWLERMENGVVAFRDGSFGLIWYRGVVEQFNPFTSMCNVEYEVIGNIHDNTELLKGGE